MNWILDCFLILLYFYIVLVVADKGLIRSIWRAVTVVGSLFLSFIIGPLLGEWICDVFVLDRISSYAFGVVTDLVENNSGQYDTTTLFDCLPQEFLNLLSRCGADLNSISADFVPSLTVSESDLYAMARAIATPISATLSKAIGVIAVYLTSVLMLFLIGLLLKLFVKLPVIRSIDKVFGMFFGFVEAFVVVWIVSLAIGVFIESGCVTNSSSEVIRVIAERSSIFKFFCGLSPIDFINIKII